MEDVYSGHTSIVLFDIEQLKREEAEICSRLISDARQKKANTYIQEADRLRCIAAGMLANFCLWKKSGDLFASLKICSNAYGKPLLENNPFYFNLSHSGKWVACAVADAPVGIDIERKRAIHPGMYRLCLTPEEQQKLLSFDGNPEEQFLRIWTVKESFSKMRGDGLRCGMNQFAAIPALGNRAEATVCNRFMIQDIRDSRLCGIAYHWKVGEDYHISVCWPCSAKRIIDSIKIQALNLKDMDAWMKQPNPVRLL